MCTALSWELLQMVKLYSSILSPKTVHEILFELKKCWTNWSHHIAYIYRVLKSIFIWNDIVYIDTLSPAFFDVFSLTTLDHNHFGPNHNHKPKFVQLWAEGSQRSYRTDEGEIEGSGSLDKDWTQKWFYNQLRHEVHLEAQIQWKWFDPHQECAALNPGPKNVILCRMCNIFLHFSHI